MKAHQIARGTLGLLAVSEVAAALLRQRDRRTTFSAAQARARELGRPLVVVGDPHAGAWTSMMPAYGCGDTCVDINGCPGCQTSHTVDLAAAHATGHLRDELDADTAGLRRTGGQPQVERHA